MQPMQGDPVMTITRNIMSKWLLRMLGKDRWFSTNQWSMLETRSLSWLMIMGSQFISWVHNFNFKTMSYFLIVLFVYSIVS